MSDDDRRAVGALRACTSTEGRTEKASGLAAALQRPAWGEAGASRELHVTQIFFAHKAEVQSR